MRELFIERKFSPASLSLIEHANRIIVEYQRQGFVLTLRQLYYQFVSRALIPNKQSEYKRLGSVINDARLAGLVDWSSIEDRTRNLKPPDTWDSPEQIIRAVATQYQENPWESQVWRPEVWIEKDALVGVIEGVCSRLCVPFFACRGYASQSEAYSAGKRFSLYERQGFTPIVFHLGDHDPSGIDMSRDNEARLAMFARSGVELRRLALNMDQIEEYNPPPNPAKDTDSRFTDYQEAFGDDSWELDALDPSVISTLVEEAVMGIVDRPEWDSAIEESEANKARLQKVSDRWDDIADYLGREDD